VPVDATGAGHASEAGIIPIAPQIIAITAIAAPARLPG
jgi:hypothetical protein